MFNHHLPRSLARRPPPLSSGSGCHSTNSPLLHNNPANNRIHFQNSNQQMHCWRNVCFPLVQNYYLLQQVRTKWRQFKQSTGHRGVELPDSCRSCSWWDFAHNSWSRSRFCFYNRWRESLGWLHWFLFSNVETNWSPHNCPPHSI